MKKMIALAATGALLAGISLAGFAADKSVEDKCKQEATKEKIASDKMDAYIKTCVKKHSSMSSATPAAPASSGK
jgi:hypothetical protein